jgi:hypothetical protein
MAYASSSTAAAQTDKIVVAAPGAGKQISVYGVHASTDTLETIAYGSGPVLEVLTVDVGAASGGTFTLTIGGNTSAAINWNDNAATVKTKVDGITGITTSTVTGAGSTADPWIITINDPAGAIVSSGNGTGLTPSDTLTVTETTAGADETIKWQQYVGANTGQSHSIEAPDELFRCDENESLTITTTASGNTFISVNYKIKTFGVA